MVGAVPQAQRQETSDETCLGTWGWGSGAFTGGSHPCQPFGSDVEARGLRYSPATAREPGGVLLQLGAREPACRGVTLSCPGLDVRLRLLHRDTPE